MIVLIGIAAIAIVVTLFIVVAIRFLINLLVSV